MKRFSWVGLSVLSLVLLLNGTGNALASSVNGLNNAGGVATTANAAMASSDGVSGTAGVPIVALETAEEAALLAGAEARQVIQFNPNAALQKRIFADGFVPNSGEFTIGAAGSNYVAQRAEHLATGRVRVYYAVVGDYGNIRVVERGNVEGNLVSPVMLRSGEEGQLIQFNPDAALQKRIFADGFVPNSAEFRMDVGRQTYAVQRAEHLRTGAVRAYYAVVGDWGNVGLVERGAAPSAPSGWKTFTSQQHFYTIGVPEGWTVQATNKGTVGQATNYEQVELRQPNYGTPNNFTTITVHVTQGAPVVPPVDCQATVQVQSVTACRISTPGGQNPPQETVSFQRAGTYYMIHMVYTNPTYVDIFNGVVNSFRLTR